MYFFRGFIFIRCMCLLWLATTTRLIAIILIKCLRSSLNHLILSLARAACEQVGKLNFSWVDSTYLQAPISLTNDGAKFLYMRNLLLVKLIARNIFLTLFSFKYIIARHESQIKDHEDKGLLQIQYEAILFV